MADITHLKEQARQIRLLILKTIHNAGVGHTGGSLSEADILTALFFHIMNVNPEKPDMEGRDRFILSKGHATPGYYSTLAHRGFFSTELLDGFDSLGSILQGHPDMVKIPGVDMSSGSLGQGLSCGLGMSMAGRLRGLDFHTYVLIGDGESAEGQNWEAILYSGAANTRVSRLIAIVDYNDVQLASRTDEAVAMGDMAAKYRTMGWTALECDGHDMEDLVSTLEQARIKSEQGPVAVIAKTVKGKGVSFMEGRYQWHGKAPNDDEYEKAVLELSGGSK